MCQRVGEIVEILTIQKEQARRREIVEWLIRCAGSSVTLPDAGELLAEKPGWPLPDDTDIGTFARELAAEQRSRLVDALLAGDALTSRLGWKLMRLAQPSRNDKRVRSAARDGLFRISGEWLRVVADFLAPSDARERCLKTATHVDQLREEGFEW